ncbi:hypothetical protein PsorP6_014029 [Peronosclerospora sorghi]|uniref:Uncharacterized protein n=1 Tax=Peronosclerospora sorghi TaxID=230839 RepID=A0ACC0VHF6_9STRA|nr:hypothetical protein PsorP6_014029 [Peronosclerospora sorghi]
MSSAASWRNNLVRQNGGFWGDPYLYELQLEKRLPLAQAMLQHLLFALPPCGKKHVLDLCAGSGRVASAVLRAYPTAILKLVDASQERLTMARRHLREHSITVCVQELTPSESLQFGTDESMDVVVACLAYHVLVESPRHYVQEVDTGLTVEEKYKLLFQATWRVLRPGGHVVFGDHVGQLALFTQLEILKSVGFEDVDCAWRVDDSFVAGGRKPLVQ